MSEPKRIVHPVCTRECTHRDPAPYPVDQRLELDWPWVQSMIDGCMPIVPYVAPPVRSIRPAPYDPRVMARPTEPEPQPYPAPLVTSRDGVQQAAPAVLTRLVRDMSDAGWTVMVQYAHGCKINGVTGGPGRELRSWAVRAYRGTWHAVAVYRGKAWDTIYVWTDRMAHTKRTVTELRMWALADETGRIAR